MCRICEIGLSKFNRAGTWGFPKTDPADHPREPDHVRPEYLARGELEQKGYHVEELSDGFYWVTNGFYDAGFVVTGEGVIAIDAPPNLGENMLAAIEEVTDAPVTHVVYSHWHSDHIGAAAMFGDKVKIIAHDITRDLLARWPDPLRPLPTETFSKDATLDVGGVKLELAYKGENHCPGNIFIYAPKQKVLTKIDIVSPGFSVFFHCDASENMTGWIEAHDQILEYDFNALIAGHVTRYGTRADVEAAREYVNDILNFS
jgi:glyoxylase-like metal-dependent hydrolase (beta-lactamase superfamily II)